MCRRETAWESRYCRNAKRSPFVCVLVWVYFEHERFESGFRDLTLCGKVLRTDLFGSDEPAVAEDASGVSPTTVADDDHDKQRTLESVVSEKR